MQEMLDIYKSRDLKESDKFDKDIIKRTGYYEPLKHYKILKRNKQRFMHLAKPEYKSNPKSNPRYGRSIPKSINSDLIAVAD